MMIAGGLAKEFGRLVREASPRYFVMENVPGILLPGARGIAEGFDRDMRRAGYELGKPWLLNAADFGVPQRRRRVFMVGARSGLPLPKAPQESGAATPTGGGMQLVILSCLRTAGLDCTGSMTARLGRPVPTLCGSGGDAPDDGDRARPRALPGALTGCDRVRQAPAVEERFRSVSPGTPEPISRFLRLHPDRPAPTIRAGTLPGRGSQTAPRPIHMPFLVSSRCVRPRRFQSMPDWFWVDHTKWSGYMQVGNAVPPLLARAVAAAVWRAVDENEAAGP